MSASTTAPLNVCKKPAVDLTLPWWVKGSEYNVLQSSVQILVNGEAAFGAVHYAIAKAKKSVCIICWGFQPSMYFVRKKADKVKYPDLPEPVPAQIGKLLEYKAEQGVKIRVLCFAYEAINPANMVVPGRGPANVTGMKELVDESNTPGRWDIHANDRPPFETDDQYKYDYEWYHHYDDKQSVENEALKKGKSLLGNKKTKNIHFTSRGFDVGDRATIAAQSYDDKGLARQTKAVLSSGASHHQKMVLVDYEDQTNAVGFVMGHNMLDEYWDTDAHSYKRHAHARDGRNGTVGPREDFSSLLTGPVLGDLFSNFNQAWQEETGEALPKPNFSGYPIRSDANNLPAAVQVLRTQVQHGVQDIKKMYLQAVNNVTNFIYIENQYFRWPPLADKICRVAKARKEAGCQDPIYLFVITNSTDAGVGKGTVNTYRMLNALGRADTIPEVARQERAEDLQAKLGQARQREQVAQVNYTYSSYPGATDANNPRQVKAKAELERARTERKKAEQALEAAQQEDAPIYSVERPGLKTHICTLVAPDTHPGMDWMEVYIHAKLMIVNDTFLTLGSANINTRSMQVDSELNIALDRPEIAKPLRQRLWQLHTNGEGAQDDMKLAFDAWEKLIRRNQKARSSKQIPLASLVSFLRTAPARSNSD